MDGTSIELGTGNWSPSDYPGNNNSFPPYTSPSWRDTNRDFTVQVMDPAIVGVFQQVFDNDFASGSNWEPSTQQETN